MGEAESGKRSDTVRSHTAKEPDATCLSLTSHDSDEEGCEAAAFVTQCIMIVKTCAWFNPQDNYKFLVEAHEFLPCSQGPFQGENNNGLPCLQEAGSRRLGGVSVKAVIQS